MHAKAFFRLKIGRVYLRQWSNLMRAQVEDFEKYSCATKNLRECKLRRLFKTMRTTILSLKMSNVQQSTARHIHSKRILAKSLGALSSFARYSIKAKYMDAKCSKANRQRLIFKALKSWQKFMLGKQTKLDMGSLADSLRRIAL